MTADGFRKVASVDVPNAAETNKSTTQTKALTTRPASISKPFRSTRSSLAT